MSVTEDEETLKVIKHNNLVVSPVIAEPPDSISIKVYHRRWFILIIFILFSSVNFMQGIQYVLIENIMTRYYNVSHIAIESSAFISSALYVFGCIPISYMIHRLDLRYSCIIAAAVSCVGTWLKVYASSPDRFVFTLIGHAIVEVWQVVIFTTPVSLSAYWFGPNEVSTATALGTMGMIVGMAVFAFIVPMVVHNHPNIADIEKENFRLTLCLAIASTLNVFLVAMFFRNEPPLPPSKSRALQKLNQKQEFNFFRPLIRVVKNKTYLLLWNAHGLIMGATVTIGTVFNRLYVLHFKNGEVDVGELSVVALGCGIAGGIIVGRIQDKTKTYKLLLIPLCIIIIFGEVSFAVALGFNAKWAVYLATAIRGLVMLAYTSTSLETCVEVMYPESEHVPIAVLNSAAQIYGMVLLVLSNVILSYCSDWVLQVFYTGIIIIGFFCLLIMKDVQNRQAAMKIEDDRIK